MASPVIQPGAPAKGRQREEQTGPPQKKKKKGGKGGGVKTAHSHQTARQHHKRRSNSPPRRHRRQDPQRGTGGPPSQNRQHQARNSGPAGKRTPKHADTHHEKKKSGLARKKGDGGTGATRPGTGTPRNRHHKAKKKAQKTHPEIPAKKGGAQPRPGPCTHAHTAYRDRKRRGASRARKEPHTSHKQADT